MKILELIKEYWKEVIFLIISVIYLAYWFQLFQLVLFVVALEYVAYTLSMTMSKILNKTKVFNSLFTGDDDKLSVLESTTKGKFHIAIFVSVHFMVGIVANGMFLSLFESSVRL